MLDEIQGIIDENSEADATELALALVEAGYAVLPAIAGRGGFLIPARRSGGALVGAWAAPYREPAKIKRAISADTVAIGVVGRSGARCFADMNTRKAVREHLYDDGSRHVHGDLPEAPKRPAPLRRTPAAPAEIIAPVQRSRESLVTAARAAIKASAESERAVEKARSDLDRASKQKADAETKKAAALRRAGAAMTDAVVNNTAPPDVTRYRKVVEREDAALDATLAAIPVLEGRLADAEAHHAELDRERSAALHEFFCGELSAAVSSLRDTLADCFTVLSVIGAIDIARLSLLGARYEIPPGAPLPRSGAAVVRRLLAAFPDDIRPETLNSESLSTASTTAAGLLVQSLNMENQA